MTITSRHRTRKTAAQKAAQRHDDMLRKLESVKEIEYWLPQMTSERAADFQDVLDQADHLSADYVWYWACKAEHWARFDALYATLTEDERRARARQASRDLFGPG